MADRGRPARLRSGFHRLERWSASAGQVERNAVYQALFAVADGSVFRKYKVLGDRARDFFVLVRKDLVIKVRRHPDVFGIDYVGKPRRDADRSCRDVPDDGGPTQG